MTFGDRSIIPYIREFDDLMTRNLFEARFAVIDTYGREKLMTDMSRPLTDSEIVSVKEEMWKFVGYKATFNVVGGIRKFFFSIFYKNFCPIKTLSVVEDLCVDSDVEFITSSITILSYLRFQSFKQNKGNDDLIIDFTIPDRKIFTRFIELINRYYENNVKDIEGVDSNDIRLIVNQLNSLKNFDDRDFSLRICDVLSKEIELLRKFYINERKINKRS